MISEWGVAYAHQHEFTFKLKMIRLKDVEWPKHQYPPKSQLLLGPSNPHQEGSKLAAVAA